MAVTLPPAAKADILRRLASAIAASDNAINVPLVGRTIEELADEEKNAREAAAAEREKVEARAEVERLEKELAEAKAKLTGKKPATPKPAGGTPDGVRASGPVPSAAEIRAWAAANDVECPARGIVPNAVRAAYVRHCAEHRSAS